MNDNSQILAAEQVIDGINGKTGFYPVINCRNGLSRVVEAYRAFLDAMEYASEIYDDLTVLSTLTEDQQAMLMTYVERAATLKGATVSYVESLMLQSLRRHRVNEVLRSEFHDAVTFLGSYAISA